MNECLQHQPHLVGCHLPIVKRFHWKNPGLEEQMHSVGSQLHWGVWVARIDHWLQPHGTILRHRTTILVHCWGENQPWATWCCSTSPGHLAFHTIPPTVPIWGGCSSLGSIWSNWGHLTPWSDYWYSCQACKSTPCWCLCTRDNNFLHSPTFSPQFWSSAWLHVGKKNGTSPKSGGTVKGASSISKYFSGSMANPTYPCMRLWGQLSCLRQAWVICLLKVWIFVKLGLGASKGGFFRKSHRLFVSNQLVHCRWWKQLCTHGGGDGMNAN